MSDCSNPWKTSPPQARAAYLTGLVEEARAIVAGTTDACPRSDHLWALLSWLDGHYPPSMGLPSDDCLPF